VSVNQHVRLMAEYNQWMNEKLYAAAATLSPAQLNENRGAFFGSIMATLNHIAVADIFWLKRFSTLLANHQALDFIKSLEQPPALNTILYDDLDELKALRDRLDETFCRLAAVMSDSELAQTLEYKNIQGVVSTKKLFSLLMHVFNHQTHHRGQLTTLFSQLGIDVGVTDLAVIIPNE
jgi:uncharacterized damage-inducible protein DinB